MCVLLGGCASPEFTPYVGKQDWPQGSGSIVETNYAVPIYYGWPDKPYIVLGAITVEGNNHAAVARYAKSKGADALIYRKTLTGNAGTYTTPGYANSITSGNFSYGQYQGYTTTTYTPGVSVPIIISVSAYNAIKWEDQSVEPLSETNNSETFDAENFKVFESSAQNGDSLAQVLVAGIYSGGVGAVQKDSAKAAYWYLRAAKQGDAESQFSIGEMYEFGDGVMQDFSEAYKWYNIAAVAPDIDWNAATNYFKSKNIDIKTLNKFKESWVPTAEKAKAARDRLAGQMTAEQIAEGQRRSAAFIPQKETPSSN